MMQPIGAEPDALPSIESRASNSLVFRSAGTNDFDGIADLICSMKRRTKNVVRTQIERIAFPPWGGAAIDYGFLLEASGGEIAGFIGWTTAHRLIRGQEHIVRNLTTWYVRESFRQYSISLARRALALDEATYTVLTAIEKTLLVWKYFKFTAFEENLRVVYPWPSLGPWRGSIVEDNLDARLSEVDLRIYMDHFGLPCHQVCLEANGEQCLVVALIKKRRLMPYARIVYASNRAFLARHISKIAVSLCRRWRVATLRVESRFVGELPHSAVRKLKSPQLFRSSLLTRDEIDSLYSEIVLLGI